MWEYPISKCFQNNISFPFRDLLDLVLTVTYDVQSESEIITLEILGPVVVCMLHLVEV